MEHTAFRTADLYRDAVVVQTASQAGSKSDAPPADAQPSGAYHGLDAEDDPAGRLSSNLTFETNFHCAFAAVWRISSVLQNLL